MINNKKGVVEVQFNWIFILIAGAVILLFFGVLVTKLRSTAEEKASSKVLTNLETILTGAQVSTGTLNLIQLPKTEIEVSCERFAITGLTRNLESEVIFAPRRIVGRELYTWTQEWAVPFRVTNFLYITSPQVRYIFIYHNEDSYNLMSKVNNSLPEEINIDIFETNDCILNKYPKVTNLKDLNNYEVRFVFFNKDNPYDILSPFQEMNDNDVTALIIGSANPSEMVSSINGVGKITFYQKQGQVWLTPPDTSKFLRKASLLGAIFSDDFEDYECNMRKAIKRLNLVAQVYKIRSMNLVSAGGPYYESSHRCWYSHDQSSNDNYGYLTKIIDYSEIYAAEKFKDIEDDAQSIEQLNDAAKLGSCILIY